MKRGKKLKNKDENLTTESAINDNADVTIKATQDDIGDNIFFQNRKSVKELVAPIGVNPNPLEYMVIIDNETNVFTICYYIHKMPRNTTFATTFSVLCNYPNVTSSVFIDPVLEGRASKLLDKKVTSLETEICDAEKAKDTNRLRKLRQKEADATRWATKIESGDNALFDVAFLFVLQDTNLENLFLKASEFHSIAREKGIDLVATPGFTFNSYGNEDRGVRIIDINENDTSKYETKVINYYEKFATDNFSKCKYLMSDGDVWSVFRYIILAAENGVSFIDVFADIFALIF